MSAPTRTPLSDLCKLCIANLNNYFHIAPTTNEHFSNHPEIAATMSSIQKYYLRILDDKVKKPHENPSIGIVLCKTADKDFVEYVIQDYAKPMGVATCRINSDMPKKLREALPDVEDLKKLL